MIIIECPWGRIETRHKWVVDNLRKCFPDAIFSVEYP